MMRLGNLVRLSVISLGLAMLGGCGKKPKPPAPKLNAAACKPFCPTRQAPMKPTPMAVTPKVCPPPIPEAMVAIAPPLNINRRGEIVPFSVKQGKSTNIRLAMKPTGKAYPAGTTFEVEVLNGNTIDSSITVSGLKVGEPDANGYRVITFKIKAKGSRRGPKAAVGNRTVRIVAVTNGKRSVADTRLEFIAVGKGYFGGGSSGMTGMTGYKPPVKL
jgi:hypothetical protein